MGYCQTTWSYSVFRTSGTFFETRTTVSLTRETRYLGALPARPRTFISSN